MSFVFLFLSKSDCLKVEIHIEIFQKFFDYLFQKFEINKIFGYINIKNAYAV